MTNPTQSRVTRLFSLALWLMDEATLRNGSCDVAALGFEPGDQHEAGLLFGTDVEGSLPGGFWAPVEDEIARPHEVACSEADWQQLWREAHADLKRLAAIEIETTEASGVSDMGFPCTHYVSFAAGRHQEHLWKRDGEESWFAGRTPEPANAALCLLEADLECRARNALTAAERAEADECEVRR